LSNGPKNRDPVVTADAKAIAPVNSLIVHVVDSLIVPLLDPEKCPVNPPNVASRRKFGVVEEAELDE
jgi:hypothetical protein